MISSFFFSQTDDDYENVKTGPQVAVCKDGLLIYHAPSDYPVDVFIKHEKFLPFAEVTRKNDWSPILEFILG